MNHTTQPQNQSPFGQLRAISTNANNMKQTDMCRNRSRGIDINIMTIAETKKDTHKETEAEPEEGSET